MSVEEKPQEATCLIKTGVKPGPNRGKSFLICNVPGCKFNRELSIPTLTCSIHVGSTVDLQILYKKSKVYYRCEIGKSLKMRTCYSKDLETEVKQEMDTEIKQEMDTEIKQEPETEIKQEPKTAIKPERETEIKQINKVVVKQEVEIKEKQKTEKEVEQEMEISSPAPESALNKTSLFGLIGKTPKKAIVLDDSIQDSPAFQGYRSRKLETSGARLSTAQPRAQPLEALRAGVEAMDLGSPLVRATARAGAAVVILSSSDEADSDDSLTVIPFDHSKYRGAVSDRDHFNSTIAMQQKLIKSMDLGKLIDGGQKLNANLQQLRDKVAKLDDEIDEMDDFCKENKIKPNLEPPTVHRMMNQFGVIVDNTNIVAPNTSSASALYQKMYGNNMVQNALYGGRMTASRVREVTHVTGEALEGLHKQLLSIPSESDELKDPEGLNIPLMPHQRQGLAWMMWRERQQPSGGILADDMGLGKTLSMIALILLEKQLVTDDNSNWMTKKTGADRCLNSSATLVVCPASLLHQWKSEIERRCSRKQVISVFHGNKREMDHNILALSDVVLTTYTIVSKDIVISKEMKADRIYDKPVCDVDKEANGRSVLLKIKWRRVICDEAHTIKNYKTVTAISTCRLNACSRWALTGTPIQNNLTDMFSLIRFIRCHPFDEFRMWKFQVDKSAKGKQRLNMLVKTLLKRRTKDQLDSKTGKPIVNLPKKYSETHMLYLSPAERLIYDRLFIQSKAKVEDYVNKHDEDGVGSDATGAGDDYRKRADQAYDDDTTNAPVIASRWVDKLQTKTAIYKDAKPLMKMKEGGNKGCEMLMIILRLRQCCSHMSLMRNALDMDAIEGEGLELGLAQQLDDLNINELRSEADLSVADLSTDVASPTKEPTSNNLKEIFERDHQSTKIKNILKFITEVIKNDDVTKRKSVVVSQWTSMLTIIEDHLLDTGIECMTIRGDVPPVKRNEYVDIFNSDTGPKVILVSLRSGGCGLNLIGGSNLFMVDMHWNPALEAQACDRIYRLGQKNDVYIHRFMCKDTIEEKIAELQKSKLELAHNVLTGAGKSANKLSLADLKLLFDIK